MIRAVWNEFIDVEVPPVHSLDSEGGTIVIITHVRLSSRRSQDLLLLFSHEK